ncbi:hypothetical protein SAMN05216410_1847 [Sanguibacter gelidistatuariae]|uniref:DUF3885 domain-containing protein n=1 Tax=Sanguibacter gelidistatuariae TaxID=1814289 RepID=A0A1G6ME87_9MICO|nr:hypothetical protein [Sanguibacter gelidistatuariae]SDC53275.1 hypothetical protein SAMN05216410_1847 [Sanguibacter gelidistatuariae]
MRGTGEFDQPEDSARSRGLTERWERSWPGTQPVGYLLKSTHEARWVRFHSLPESKRYAELPEEHEEILRRHRTVLAELLTGSGVESLIVVARDCSPGATSHGSTIRTTAERTSSFPLPPTATRFAIGIPSGCPASRQGCD